MPSSRNRAASLGIALVVLLGACADVTAPAGAADDPGLDPARRSGLLAAVDDATSRLVPALTGDAQWTGMLAATWVALGAEIDAGDAPAARDAAAQLAQLLAESGAATSDDADVEALRLTLDALRAEL